MIRQPLAPAAPWLLLLAWAPLPLGSVTRGAASLLQAATLLAAVSALALAVGPLPAATRRAACFVLALAALGFAQSLPWPASLARALAPEPARLASESAELLGHAPSPLLAASLAPDASRRAALAWVALAAALVGAALVARSRRARRALLATLLGSALFQVFFGAQQWFAQARTIWGIAVPNDPSRLLGSFVNANHMATYLVIAVALAFAWLWWSLRRVAVEARAESTLTQLAAPGLTLLALFAGLAFTRSRSGLLAALVGCAAQLVLVGLRPERRRIAWAGLAGLLLALGFVATSGFEAGFGRLLGLPGTGGSASMRLSAMERTFVLWQLSPWTGVGAGSFAAAFPLVQNEATSGVWTHAHNDWLELLATMGVVGCALLACGLLALGRGLGRSWRLGERSEDRAAALAAIGACVAVGLQELVEFGLTMPANALTLAVVCGAALAVPKKTAEETLPGANVPAAGEGLESSETATLSGSCVADATVDRVARGGRR